MRNVNEGYRTTYVLSEPETVPVHLVILSLEMQFLVQLQIELFSNLCAFFVQTISKVTKTVLTRQL
jgi:hypothetical protein